LKSPARTAASIDRSFSLETPLSSAEALGISRLEAAVCAVAVAERRANSKITSMERSTIVILRK
jgi:hypothetical protein